jgi:hypothetical protein
MSDPVRLLVYFLAGALIVSLFWIWLLSNRRRP